MASVTAHITVHRTVFRASVRVRVQETVSLVVETGWEDTHAADDGKRRRCSLAENVKSSPCHHQLDETRESNHEVQEHPRHGQRLTRLSLPCLRHGKDRGDGGKHGECAEVLVQQPVPNRCPIRQDGCS